MTEDNIKVLLTEAEVDARINDLGAQISKDYDRRQEL